MKVRQAAFAQLEKGVKDTFGYKPDLAPPSARPHDEVEVLVRAAGRPAERPREELSRYLLPPTRWALWQPVQSVTDRTRSTAPDFLSTSS